MNETTATDIVETTADPVANGNGTELVKPTNGQP